MGRPLRVHANLSSDYALSGDYVSSGSCVYPSRACYHIYIILGKCRTLWGEPERVSVHYILANEHFKVEVIQQ